MSRRTDLVQQLLKSDSYGLDKEKEEKFILATAELILVDFINIALNGVEQHGAGSLIINLVNDSTAFMSGHDVEADIAAAESEEDAEVLKFLRDLIEQIDKNDWTKNVLITLISNEGTRTFAVEAGGSQESLRAFAEEFTGSA
jgi:hypothetical protein